MQSIYRLRPSAASVWVLCNGAPLMAAGALVADDEDTTVREYGTATHWAAHQTSLGLPPALGEMSPNGVEVDQEMLDIVRLYLDTVASWGIRAFFEQPVHCKHIHPECGGVTDVCGYNHVTRTIYLADLKAGFRFVDVWRCWQLLCYLVGVLDFFKIWGESGITVQFTIVQPRSYHRDGPVRVWRVALDELHEHFATLREAAHRALGSNPTCTVNAGCRNCDGRARCTTLQNSALSELDSSHEATPHDLPFAAAEDELRRLQWAQNIVAARITGLETQVMHEMKRGAVSKHFGLQAEAGRLHWNEGADKALAALEVIYHKELRAPAKPITPTQAKALIPEQIVDMYATRRKGAVKLIPADATLMRRIFGKM